MRCFHDFQFQKAIIQVLICPWTETILRTVSSQTGKYHFQLRIKTRMKNIKSVNNENVKIPCWSTLQTKNIFHFCAHWNTSECILLQNKFLLLSAILLGLFENGNEASRQEEGQSSGEILEFLNFVINAFAFEKPPLPLSFRAQYYKTALIWETFLSKIHHQFLLGLEDAPNFFGDNSLFQCLGFQLLSYNYVALCKA